MYRKDMTNERPVNPDREVMRRYEFGELAGRFLNSGADGERNYAMIGALEKQLDQFGLNALDRKNLMNGFNNDASEKAKLGFIDSCSNTYHEYAGKLKMSEHLADYDAVLRGYLGEGSDEYIATRASFEAFGDETLGSITKKVAKAQVIVKNAEALGYAQTTIDDAKNTLRRYNKILSQYGVLETNKFEAMRSDAVKPTIKQRLKNLATAD